MRVIKHTILLLVFSGIHGTLFSQQLNSDTTKGSVTILQDHRLDTLLGQHLTINEKKKCMPGYRIQIYFGNERAKAYEMRTEFLKRYADVAADVQYQKPNFKTRVGNFRNRMQAKKFLKEITSAFPAAFIVKDEIALPDLSQ